MTGTELSSTGLDERRRRLLFRCWHRGIREMDLVMGRFADAHLAGFTKADLDAFEPLLSVPDQEFFAWLIGTAPVAPEFDTPMFHALREFHLSGGASA